MGAYYFKLQTGISYNLINGLTNSSFSFLYLYRCVIIHYLAIINKQITRLLRNIA